MASLDKSVFSGSKILLHDRIRNLFDREKLPSREDLLSIYPVMLEIGPSGNCNNKCSFCMHGRYYDNKKTMSFELYKKIIDETSGYEDVNKRTKGVIYSSSGEPLINPRINDFITYTKKKDIDVALITNGTALSKKNVIETVLYNASWARVSLNAGTAETRLMIHGTSLRDYGNVINSLSRMGQLKAQGFGNCHLGAQIVVTEDNVDEIVQATEIVRDTGIDYFQIKPVIFHPMDGREQLGVEFWNRVVEISNKAKDIFESGSFDVFVKMDQFDAVRKEGFDRDAYPNCLAAFSPIIEADGTVYHCSQTRGLAGNQMGDLSKQSFEEIWEGGVRRNMFMGIDVKDCQPVCRCHPNNKVLTELLREGITEALGENLKDIKAQGGCGSSFI